VNAPSESTLLYISGATSGIGAALAATCPYENTTLVNVSRRVADGMDSVRLDLTQPDTWVELERDFARRLGAFDGTRVVFIHNAFFQRRAFAGEGTASEQWAEVMANIVAPVVFGDMFLRAVTPCVDRGIEAGLVQVSSGAARIPYPALAVYGAGKASMEQWVRAARLERERRGAGPWILAIRPGFVDTPSARADAARSAEDFPAAPALAHSLATREGVLDASDAASMMWDAVLHRGEKAVVYFGDAVGA
jgi:benzil reductase ((S)-benzoin forming)